MTWLLYVLYLLNALIDLNILREKLQYYKEKKGAICGILIIVPISDCVT